MALFTKTKVFVKEAVFSLKKKKIAKENQVIKDEMMRLVNLNDAVSKLYSFLFCSCINLFLSLYLTGENY